MSVKVYQNVLNFARTAEAFLFLDGAGCSAEIPEDFWQSLASYPENVQSYIACLIARLISLESKHGLRPLGDVYRELCMTGDDTKSFKSWLTKDGGWDHRRKHLAVYLQHAIISTIHHLKTFYGYVPHPCVKAMYTFWAYARGPDGYNPADEFECKVLQDLAVLSTQQHPSLGRWFYQIVEDEEELGRQVRELVDQCSRDHRQPRGALLDLSSASITNYAVVAKSLSYYQLVELLRHNSNMADVAITYIMQRLHEVTTSSDIEESEITILPLLQLFKAIAPMSPNVNVIEAYQSLMPLYLWPQPYSCEARKVLDFLQADTRVKGTTFRKTILAEQNVSSVKGLYTEQTTFLIIDRSNGVCRSSAFAKAFEAGDSRVPSGKVKKLLIKHLFMTLGEWGSDQLEDLEQHLQNCAPLLDDYCKEMLAVAEMSGDNDGEDNTPFIQAELKKFHEQIIAQSNGGDISSVGRRESRSPSEDNGDPLQLSTYPMLPMEVKMVESLTPKVMEDTLRKCLQESLAKDSKIQRKHNTTYGRHKRGQKRRSMEKCRESTVVSDEQGDGSTISDSCGDHAENGWEQHLDSPTTKSPPKSPPFIQPLSTGNGKDLPSRTSSLSSGEFPDMEHESSSPSHGSSYSSEPQNTLNPRPPSAGSSPYVSPSTTMLFQSGKVSSPVRTRKGTTSQKSKSSVKYNSLRKRAKTFSPDGATSTPLREVKIAISGNDRTVSRMAQAYALLRQNEPDLFSNLVVQFYYVPLSVSTFTRGEDSSSKRRESPLPEHMLEHSQNSLVGEDVWLACYLSQFDSWYERNVLLAVHNTLRIIPALDETEDTPVMRARINTMSSPRRNVVPISIASSHVPPSPPQILKEIVCSYCRNAESMVKLQMYKAQIQVKGDKNVKSAVKYFLQRLDVQKLTKKAKGAPKPFEAMIVVEELSLDDTHIPSQVFKFKDLWSLRASNVPRPEDDTLASPEADSLELHLVRGQKSADAEDFSFHIHKFVLEAKDKPFSLMLDSDFENIIENVLRVEVEAAQTRRLPTSSSGALGMNSVSDEAKDDPQIYFPLMTFWPMDLQSS